MQFQIHKSKLIKNKKKKKLFLFFPNYFLKPLLTLACLIIMVLLWYVYRIPELRIQQAAEPVCQSLPIQVPVVVMGYIPPDPKNSNQIDPVETGWTADRITLYSGKQNLTLQDWQNNVTQMATTMSQFISDATRYHGYKDPNALEFLHYKIIDTKFFNRPIPHSTYVVTTSNGTLRPDYHKAMQDLGNVCTYVDTQGVKEIWLYSYHNEGLISPDESRMASKYGDVSNSYPADPGFPSQFQLPQCQHSYVMYNFETWPDPTFIDNTVHDRLHQIENIMSFATDTYQITWPHTQPNPNNLFWYNFALYSAENKGQISCGDTHNPPNTNLLNNPYHYNATASAQINCETWNVDPKKSTFISSSCQSWGCTDLGYYKWWMQSLPGYNNGIIYQGKPMRNWWEAMYDFNGFIGQERSLFGKSLFSCIANTTPTVSQGNVSTVTGTPTPIISQGKTMIPTITAVPTSIAPILFCLGQPCTVSPSITISVPAISISAKTGTMQGGDFFQFILNSIKKILAMIFGGFN